MLHTVTVCNAPATPSKIVCIGRNYAAHAAELGNEIPDEMVVFLKPNSAIGDTLHAQNGGEPLHYEGEIVFAVANGQPAAVGFGLDLTRRALQSTLKGKGLPWERAKAFDGAALFSDFVALPDDIDALEVLLEVNGDTRQRGGVPLMLYRPATIFAQLQSFLTLEDGDLVMTGTPQGVGEVGAGERFTGSVLYRGATLVSATWVAQ